MTDGQGVLLARIAELERQRNNALRRLSSMRQSRNLWMLRAQQRGALIGKARRGSR